MGFKTRLLNLIDDFDGDASKLTWFLKFTDKQLQTEFFEFISFKRISIITLVATLAYGVAFLFSSLIMLIRTHYWHERVLSACGSAAALITGLSGSYIIYLQYQYTRKKSSTLLHRIQYAHVPFIWGVSVFNICFVLLRTYATNCDNIPKHIVNWFCSGLYGQNAALYSSIFAFSSAPVIMIVMLREIRLSQILASLLLHLVAFLLIEVFDHESYIIALQIMWFGFLAGICIDIHGSRVSKFLKQKKLQEALGNMERMQAEDRATELRHMIGNVAHDLKTPLSSFMTGLDLISATLQELEGLVVDEDDEEEEIATIVQQEEKDQKDKKHKFVQRIQDIFQIIQTTITTAHNTNAFMLMTINRCIDYTKASKGIKLTPHNETVHLQQALQLPLDCMKNIQERIKIELLGLPKEICTHIITDKQWLQENVLCLLSNAVKYSTEGTVMISIHLADADGNSLFRVEEGDRFSILSSFSPSFRSKQPQQRYKPPNYLHHANSNKVYPMNDHLFNTSFTEENSIRKAHPNRFLSPFKSSLLPNNNIDPMISSDDSSSSKYFLRVEIEDHGIGLSEEIKQTLFLCPFKQQAQRLTGGTGLGLYSLAKRMEAVQGKYGVQSRKDGKQGSMFWFAIPYRPDRVSANGPSFKQAVSSWSLPTKSSSTIGSIPNLSCSSFNVNNNQSSSMMMSSIMIPSIVKEKWKILVVEDSPTISKMIVLMLTRQGHEVIVAENGEIALQYLTKNEHKEMQDNHGFDFLLMDFQMPVMDGLEATRRIRAIEQHQQHPHSPLVIIGMSANSDSETVHEAKIAGVTDYMPKPFTMNVFHQIIDKHITNNNRRKESSAVA